MLEPTGDHRWDSSIIVDKLSIKIKKNKKDYKNIIKNNEKDYNWLI